LTTSSTHDKIVPKPEEVGYSREKEY